MAVISGKSGNFLPENNWLINPKFFDGITLDADTKSASGVLDRYLPPVSIAAAPIAAARVLRTARTLSVDQIAAMKAAARWGQFAVIEGGPAAGGLFSGSVLLTGGLALILVGAVGLYIYNKQNGGTVFGNALFDYLHPEDREPAKEPLQEYLSADEQIRRRQSREITLEDILEMAARRAAICTDEEIADGICSPDILAHKLAAERGLDLRKIKSRRVSTLTDAATIRASDQLAAVRTLRGSQARGEEDSPEHKRELAAARNRVEKWLSHHGRWILTHAQGIRDGSIAGSALRGHLEGLRPADLALTGIDPLVSVFDNPTAQEIFGELVPQGVTPLADDRSIASFWAPSRNNVEILLRRSEREFVGTKLKRDSKGFYNGIVDMMTAGAAYMLKLSGPDGRAMNIPDPYSRFQEKSVYGPSVVDAPRAFRWHGQKHRHHSPTAMRIVELHVGSVTKEGTYAALMSGRGREYLERLLAMGFNTFQVMPVHKFPGIFGWGYDGVLPFAVQDSYGTPDQLREFIKFLHKMGFSVIADVVLNHLGIEGVVFQHLDRRLIASKDTPWGWQLNFTGRRADGSLDKDQLLAARQNRILARRVVRMYLDDFGFDSIRLDQPAYIGDPDRTHEGNNFELMSLLNAEIADTEPDALLFVEDERNINHLWGNLGPVYPWSFDFQHVVANTLGDTTYKGYRTMGDLFQVMRLGVLTPSRIAVLDGAHIKYLASHDEVGNHGGKRMAERLTHHKYLMGTALTAMSVGIPMVFMGDESRLPTPFSFIRDLERHRESDVSIEAQHARARQRREREILLSDQNLAKRDRRTELLMSDLLRLRRDSEAFRTFDYQTMREHYLGDGILVLSRSRDRRSRPGILVMANYQLNHFGKRGKELHAVLPAGKWRLAINTRDTKYTAESPSEHFAVPDFRSDGKTPVQLTIPAESVVIFKKID